MHVDGWEGKDAWDWEASIIEGPFKKKKGQARSAEDAKKQAEAAAKKLNSK